MKSRLLIEREEKGGFSPQLILIRLLLRWGRWAHHFLNLRMARYYFELAGKFFSLFGRGPAEKIKINGLKAEILGHRPEYKYLNQAERLIFYLHGGAFVSGSPQTHRHLIQRIAREAQAVALSIDYRLAPEFPYPAALEDSFLAYCWLIDQKFESGRVALVGDSAGGGLAVALVQRLVVEGLPLPACVCLLSPWVDLTCSSEAYLTRPRGDPMVSQKMALERARLYAGKRDLTNPCVSPLYGSFWGFPPLFILVGSDEVLYDDAYRLAQKASQSGVKVQLEVWAGMFHVWPYLFPLLSEGRQACHRLGLFIRQAIPRRIIV